MPAINRLREERRELSAQLFQLGAEQSPAAHASFQRRLAAAILSAETEIAASTGAARDELLGHLRLLRAHGDALAWIHLHPHAIRQLRKGGIRAQALSSQRDAVEGALAVVDRLASEGVVALVTDLTSDLRLGDVVVADDPEAPTIVECKRTLPREGSLLLGRRGRQAARMQSISKYMRKGEARQPGDRVAYRCFESSRPATTHWQALATAIELSLKEQRNVVEELEPGFTIWIRRGDDEVPEQIKASCGAYRRVVIGLHLRFLDDDAPLMPPPLAWPVSDEARSLLTEGDLSVATIIDVERFVDHASARGRRIGVREDGSIEVLSGEVAYVVSPRLVEDCVYSFHSISGQVDAVLEFVDWVAGQSVVPISPETPPPEEVAPGRPSRVHRIDSMDGLTSLAERSRPGDTVLVASNFFAEMAPGEKAGVVYWQTGGTDGDEE